MLIGKWISFSWDGVWIVQGLSLQIANGGMPLYLNPHVCVNTILTHFPRLPTPCAVGRRDATAQRDAATQAPQWSERSVRDRSLTCH